MKRPSVPYSKRAPPYVSNNNPTEGGSRNNSKIITLARSNPRKMFKDSESLYAENLLLKDKLHHLEMSATQLKTKINILNNEK